MNIQHQELASGRWSKLSFLEQMANVGSEVERTLNWRAKHNPEYSQKAFNRALELLDLTLYYTTTAPHFKELTRLREALVDFFTGNNDFKSTDASWRKYFLAFTYAARRHH